MDERTFDRSQQHASVIGLGTWQLGADWGDVDDKEALAVLETAAEAGVTFFDTADVYGDGRSEQTIASFVGGRPDLHVLVATKMGRRVDQIPEKWQWILSLNPMTSVIAGWRWAVLDASMPDLGQTAVGVAVALFLFVGGLAVFRSSEPRFADTI